MGLAVGAPSLLSSQPSWAGPAEATTCLVGCFVTLPKHRQQIPTAPEDLEHQGGCLGLMVAVAQGEAAGQDMGTLVMSLGWVWDIHPMALLENRALGTFQDARNA